MSSRQIQLGRERVVRLADLEAELEAARQALLAAEQELAQKQAAVNAFRLHCRLKLDDLVEQLFALRAEKQAARTRLELLRQAQDYGIAYDDDDPFWRADEVEMDVAEEELLLPTDTPRDRAAEKRLYRQLARRFHPDLANAAVEVAYRTDMMALVNEAYAAADVQMLYDLAGELDPLEAAALARIATPEARRLRRRILACRRRERKARRRLKLMLGENTALLWQRSQYLEMAEDEDWWQQVRRDILQVSGQLQTDIDHLQLLIAEIEAPAGEEDQ